MGRMQGSKAVLSIFQFLARSLYEMCGVAKASLWYLCKWRELKVYWWDEGNFFSVLFFSSSWYDLIDSYVILKPFPPSQAAKMRAVLLLVCIVIPAVLAAPSVPGKIINVKIITHTHIHINIYIYHQLHSDTSSWLVNSCWVLDCISLLSLNVNVRMRISVVQQAVLHSAPGPMRYGWLLADTRPYPFLKEDNL